MHDLPDSALLVLREEFPNVNASGDTDIERYFELRKIGRQADALALYDGKLRRKYPDDEKRAELMRAYRSRDPRYGELLRENLHVLAGRAVAKTTAIIDFLTRDIASVNLSDAYAVIKLAEGLLSVISPDRYAAISFAERYARLARILSHREAEMEKTAELIRLYVTDTIDSVLEFRKEAEERRHASERERRQRQKRMGLDLSKIVFSPADVARIVIPEGITGTEDTVIAYCLKYWNLTRDSAFEKTVLLYSRKYHTRHYEIFTAIKNGREHGWKDEEILNAVLANVVTGYYYSITGDLYLQRTWARYREGLSGNSSQLPAAETQPSATVTRPARAIPTPAAPKVKALKVKRLKATQLKPRATGKKREKNAAAVSPRAKPVQREKPVQPAKQLRAKPLQTNPSPVRPLRAQTIRKRTGTQGGAVSNSIADMIRKGTGKTYTVYKDLFFRGIRPSIRDTLTDSGRRKANIFSTKQNEAEEIIYNFLFEHYENPFQNWEKSEARLKVEELGFSINNIEPIIAHWIRKNR